MKLVRPELIKKIDEYAILSLGISARELMERSGRAVADAIKSRLLKSSRIIILCGGGNNGGDGYAAALMLMSDYEVVACDVFEKGQRSAEGEYYLSEYKSRGGRMMYGITEKLMGELKESCAIVDAVLGTGFVGELSEDLKMLSGAISESSALKVAVDVPLGVNADDGSVSEYTPLFDLTVELSFIKRGIVSYPAREYVGEIIYSDIGLPIDKIEKVFSLNDVFVDDVFAKSTLPKRKENSNKGSFGKLLLIVGSEKYRGAAHLATEAALRSGVGLVSFLGEDSLVSELSKKFPEVIYEKCRKIKDFSEEDINSVSELSKKYSAILIGSGSDMTEGLRSLVLALIKESGCPLIIDADAINVIASLKNDGLDAIKSAKRRIILTPHPLEFSRLTGISVEDIQKKRIHYAEHYSRLLDAVIVLKGAATVIADKGRIYINSTGSSALAKGGSGDVLAGVMASFIAQNSMDISDAAALSVYLHAKAGDVLADELSKFGVTPSDLPREIAKQIKKTASR